jgi:phage/plasmid-associated DNA primase
MNGKTTLFNFMKEIMSSFYSAISEDVLSHKAMRGSTTSELMPLQRARLCVASELKENSKIDENRMKILTGDDDISGREIYEKQTVFRTQSKFVSLTNKMPQFNVEDGALRQRIAVIPFVKKFDDSAEGKAFVETLKEQKHLDVLFSILAHKAHDFYERGMMLPARPAILNMAKDNYIGELDTVSQFIDEHIDIQPMEPKPEGTARWECHRPTAFEMYQEFCRAKQQNALDQNPFYKSMGKRFLGSPFHHKIKRARDRLPGEVVTSTWWWFIRLKEARHESNEAGAESNDIGPEFNDIVIEYDDMGLAFNDMAPEFNETI